MTRPRILVFASYYLPGYKGGGPVRTLANVVRLLGDDFELKVITRDRDPGDTATYPGVTPHRWTRVGKADVFYLSPGWGNALQLRKVIAGAQMDAYYLNSFFELILTNWILLLHRMHLIPRRPILLAPRGQFSPAALRIKGLRKRLFMRVGRILRLWNDCAWHLSSEKELNDTAEVFPQACERSEINIDLSVEVPVDNPIPDKRSGVLDICYCGRVSPIKNLEFVFKVLGALRGQVTYRIFGPLEDPEYVAECERRMAQLPENIRVVFEGPRAFEEIHDIYLEQHVMFMPSKGENFGHSIQESLAAACPVLISDRTPWTGLEEMGLGWDLSLSRPEAFVEVLQGLIDMDTAEYTQYRKRLHECAREHLEQTRLVPGYRDMFARLVASRD